MKIKNYNKNFWKYYKKKVCQFSIYYYLNNLCKNIILSYIYDVIENWTFKNI